MSTLRFMHEAKAKKNMCRSFFARTKEREEVVYFSIPSMVYLGNSIIFRRNTYEELGHPSIISFEEFMKKTKYRGAVFDRFYGTKIDNIILKFGMMHNIQVRFGDVSNNLKMLISGRIDYIIEFPSVINYLLKNYRLNIEDFISVPLKESENIVTCISCTKNEWGKNIISRVNEILIREIPTKRYQDIVLMWSNKKEEDELIKYYNSGIKSNVEVHSK
ncbi:MAG: transporter substrate-binding domain-containing protein [Desulfobacterales bacterium]|nr:transporter substrate-binding domain-containing protein [Desulfobacterales bacterium]